jgi:hypothetical protein
MSCTVTTLWTSSTEEKYMGRTAIAWGSVSAHNLEAYSQSELGFATHFNMYPEVQLPSPNGSLGHTRGQVNCAMARSKALINASMHVYFIWNRKSHISNVTAKSVGSHSVSNTRCHGISVDDCAKTENLYTAYEAVLRPGAGSQNRFVCGIQGPVSLTIGDQNAIKSCRWSSSFYLHAVLIFNHQDAVFPAVRQVQAYPHYSAHSKRSATLRNARMSNRVA